MPAMRKEKAIMGAKKEFNDKDFREAFLKKGARPTVKAIANWHYICPNRHQWFIVSENRNASLAHLG